MSDKHEADMERMWEHFSALYMLTVAICALLPIPIELPRGLVTSTQMRDSIRRVAEIASDQPIPEVEKANLWAGCIAFLAALDLFSIMMEVEDHPLRKEGTEAVLMTSEKSLRALSEWVSNQE